MKNLQEKMKAKMVSVMQKVVVQTQRLKRDERGISTIVTVVGITLLVLAIIAGIALIMKPGILSSVSNIISNMNNLGS